MMLTRRERFEQWRGTKSNSEQGIFDTSLLIEDYLASVDSLSQIKNDFADSNNGLYNKLNVYTWRAFGAIVYCKLIVEESIDLLPEAAKDDLALFWELKNILAEVFDTPRKNPVHNSNRILEIMRLLLSKKVEDISDLKQARVLCFTLYFILALLNAGIDSLSDWKRLAINAFVDVDKIKRETVALLKMAEEQNILLEAAIAEQKRQELLINHDFTIQGCFNERFATLFQNEENEERLFIKLHACLGDISDGLNSIIAARKKLQTTTSHSQELQSFLRECMANDFKIKGRTYFLDLIHHFRKPFHLLMDLSHGAKRDQLVLSIEQLKSPGLIGGLSSGVLYGMSWATSLITLFYRRTFSQTAQDSIEKMLPSTWDSQCKAELKILIRECLARLERQLIDEQNELNDAISQLARKDIKLIKLLEQESDEQLEVLLKTNHGMSNGLSEYRRIVFNLNQKRHFLSQFKETYTVLRIFAETHNNWLVKLSNFFAQFFSFFKSDTAHLIDRACELNDKLLKFESDYQKEVNNGLETILAHPDLPKTVKDKFKDEFVVFKSKGLNNLIDKAQDKEAIRELISNTSLFFSKPVSRPFDEKQRTVDYDDLDTEIDDECLRVLCAIRG